MSAETRLLGELVQATARASSLDHFLAATLPLVTAWGHAVSTALWIARSGHWQCVARYDARPALDPAGHPQLAPPPAPPLTLLADAADGETICRFPPWTVWPIRCSAWPTALLVLESARPEGDFPGPAFGDALEVVHGRALATTRAQLLRRLLEAAVAWHQLEDLDELLHQITNTARELLDADRAIVYLWDPQEHVLVGRPIPELGGRELRVPDTAGIPGLALRSREVQTIDPPQALDDVCRQIDRLLGEETRNLLCLPLLASRGPCASRPGRELLGALEVRNRNLDSTRDLLPLLADELARQVSSALANTRELTRLRATNRRQLDALATQYPLLGESEKIVRLRDALRRVAASNLAVLILGEHGTGKEVASRQIHQLSERRARPFIAVNCAAMTESLVESELFGHEQGAYTDAHQTRSGKFELAAGGTLFLDEIGELPLGSQVKLLRVLEEKMVTRVGGSEPLTTDTRIIAATNRDLAALVRAGEFREDLFYRLNVVAIELPPLRERGEDVLLLADYFLDEFCQAAHRGKPRLTRAAQKRLLSHTWPGNVRELRNLMERVAYLLAGDSVDENDLLLSAPGLQLTDACGTNLTDATRQFQVTHIENQIRASAGNMTEAARRLGLHRSNLYRKMKQLGMRVDDEADAQNPSGFQAPAPHSGTYAGRGRTVSQHD